MLPPIFGEDVFMSIKIDERLKHIAFIMDGNGRWAQKRGMPRYYGHRYGAKKFREILEYCLDIGVLVTTVYAFSTENWTRPKKEVDSIMKILDSYLDECYEKKDGYDVHYRFIGDMSLFDGYEKGESIIRRMKELDELTSMKSKTINIAVNYGGRDEIVAAVNKLISEGKNSVTKEDISSALYTAPYPEPDLIIRTGGDLRISNFLLWQSAYSELYFTPTLWPDLTTDDVDKAIEEFYSRKRRYGGV